MFIHEQAKARAVDQHLGWFLEPLVRGDYPFSMRALVGDRLPYFTNDEQKKLMNSFHLLGLNYYTSRFAKHIDISPSFKPKYNTDDIHAEILVEGPHGDIGPSMGNDWIYSHPKGLKELLMTLKDKYSNPAVYITENGMADVDDGNLPVEDALNDTKRINYLLEHIAVVKESVDMGANVRGHFTWSLMDDFEWFYGFEPRYGLIYVDRNNGHKRHMKRSAKWFALFNGVTSDSEIERKVTVVI